MIGLSRGLTVFAFTEPVDMRKSFNTLGALVAEQMKREVLTGDLFLFVSNDRKRAKVLYFDGTGLCLLSKRLEKGKFSPLWKKKRSGGLEMSLREATLGGALKLLLDDRLKRANAGRASHHTVSFYAVKAGHLSRIFEHDAEGKHTPFPLAKLRAYDVDRYISKRRAEHASESTISKELVALRASLKLALRAGIWARRTRRRLPDRLRPGVQAAHSLALAS